MKQTKRASMQLSINAIVILVMAMAVLGIGLGLIRGVLAPAQDNLEDAIGKVDLSESATSTHTIANVPKSMKMKASSTNELAVSFYNTGKKFCSDYATVRLNCGDYVLTKYDSVLSVPAKTGEATTMLAIVDVSSAGAAGTLPNTVTVLPDGKGATGSQACKVEIICSDAKIESVSLANADGVLNTVVDSTIPTGTTGTYVAESIATFVRFG